MLRLDSNYLLSRPLLWTWPNVPKSNRHKSADKKTNVFSSQHLQDALMLKPKWILMIHGHGCSWAPLKAQVSNAILIDLSLTNPAWHLTALSDDTINGTASRLRYLVSVATRHHTVSHSEKHARRIERISTKIRCIRFCTHRRYMESTMGIRSALERQTVVDQIFGSHCTAGPGNFP